MQIPRMVRHVRWLVRRGFPWCARLLARVGFARRVLRFCVFHGFCPPRILGELITFGSARLPAERDHKHSDQCEQNDAWKHSEPLVAGRPPLTWSATPIRARHAPAKREYP